MLKVLNLYAGIGGNRKLWKDVQVTAVESDIRIAQIYRESFLEDVVIVGDAHQYLLENYDEGWDFIWSSRPCQTHSCIRAFAGVGSGQVEPAYPDMGLYEEILFLKAYSKCAFVVENVVPWYKPLLEARKIGKHLFWSNFEIADFDMPSMSEDTRNQVGLLEKHYGMDLSAYTIKNKLRILRNCVLPELGEHIFNCAFKTKQTTLDRTLRPPKKKESE